ncbi:hypothetical protein [Pseudomonas sp. UBA6562]|uniref:hypothetical protein n=1 Tax=Pseudomonas sp. UBA6562 TaxID=1947332 RepID=UPI0025EB71B5|nr:hypothetical protein [Pseudomonas sp. UBA6562]
MAYAKSSWKDKPRGLFSELKEVLTRMCSGNARCVYCEDSLAYEIEHMRPKDLFPEVCYAWSNYVLACGPCNGPKNNKFAVLVEPLKRVDITRKPNAAVVPPERGRPALLDPRVDDPLDFLWLDFRTFRYVPNTDDDMSEVWLRADYTIDVLGLNKRDALVRGRRSAFSGFNARLSAWINQQHQLTAVERQVFIEDFRNERYRGVWERMKRYNNELPLLAKSAELIKAAPEALQW